MTRRRHRHSDDVQMRETRSEDETRQMSGDESRRLQQTSGADDDHHEEPPTTTGNFLEVDDPLKMTLFLITNNVLFGQSFDKKVTPWLFNLVYDLEAFNGFAWGHYVFKMTLHYLRHGFRSRNSKKEYGKVWAMEVVDNLIDGFGMRLQDTLPRLRRWTMHKRPQNFVQTILDLEASIRSEKADVKEVLEATDDEAQADYWVGVDYNMMEGP
ncbi:hypothetical protein Ddye_017725 [Dipteronia dyeriana]|uniref:Aminotransferase-like plant mobile domain-containing protein n=1 Tax=Dipteronia dyeriana TaxID=168575 RepID=A0AAD9X0S8_9ROSI|nr:hypothetical protein Ddye_017725 [Dipteronia dyeriana]